jgi:hypothetical protein
MRFKKQIDLNQLSDSYQPNSYISFNLPREKIDLHSLSLYYTGNAANYRHTEFTGTYTKKFSGESQFTVVLTNNAFRVPNHGFKTGDEVTYSNGGGTSIKTGVNMSNVAMTGNYFIIRLDNDFFKIAVTQIQANAETHIPLYQRGAGDNHSFSRTSATTYKTIKRFFPRLSQSVIQELTIKKDNVIIQHIDQFNMLYSILNDVYKEFDDIDSSAQDTVQNHYLDASGVIKNFSKIQAPPRVYTFLAKYDDNDRVRFHINKFLGFLSEGNRYYDATNTDIQVTIKLAPASILYRGINSEENYVTSVEFAPDYILTDISASIDVVDDAPMQENFVFKDYRYTEGVYNPLDKKCLCTLQIDKPLEYIFGTFSNPNRLVDNELLLAHCNTDEARFGYLLRTELNINDINNKIPDELLYSYEIAKFQKESYVKNNSVYFDTQGRGIRSCRYLLNNYELCPRLDMLACFNETRKCFGSDYKRVPNLYAFEENFFLNAIRLDDTSNEIKKLDWEVEVDPSKGNRAVGGTPMLFCCFSNQA